MSLSSIPGGVWSAAPTPFTAEMAVDTESVRRMVEHHLRLGVSGLFLAGTNGEGPWMPTADRRALVRATVECARGRLPVAVQVTDNSAARILDNMRMAREDGADIAVIAPPFFLFNAGTRNLIELYRHAIRESPLPVGIYDRGNSGAVPVPDDALAAIYAEKKVVLIKDSSADPARMEIALAAKRRRPKLVLLNGWEFHCVEYLRAGYNGLLLGGGVFNGCLAGMIVAAVRAGRIAEANRLQARMNRLMYRVYGGKNIRCWLSGEKKLLVEMGIFTTWKNYLNYPLTKSCLAAIEKSLREDADVLFPREKEPLTAKLTMRRTANDNPYLHQDFHGALSAGLEYLHEQYGEDAVRRYLRGFAESYYAPLTREIATRGLSALREHLERIYAIEGGEIFAEGTEDELRVEIPRCPAVTHLRAHGYPVARLFYETSNTVYATICAGTPFELAQFSYEEATGRASLRFTRRTS